METNSSTSSPKPTQATTPAGNDSKVVAGQSDRDDSVAKQPGEQITATVSQEPVSRNEPLAGLLHALRAEANVNRLLEREQ